MQIILSNLVGTKMYLTLNFCTIFFQKINNYCLMIIVLRFEEMLMPHASPTCTRSVTHRNAHYLLTCRSALRFCSIIFMPIVELSYEQLSGAMPSMWMEMKWINSMRGWEAGPFLAMHIPRKITRVTIYRSQHSSRQNEKSNWAKWTTKSGSLGSLKEGG